jgi:two-component system, OmpR family, response regulator RegX3
VTPGHILIADDEPSVRESIAYALRREDFEVTIAADGLQAEAAVDENDFDLVILDIMMPGRSGLDLCRELRGKSAIPIILLTARDDEIDKVVGLEIGADDYVTKPFSVRELVGRVRAQLRRRELDRSTREQGTLIEAGPVSIDLARQAVTVRGQPVNVTPSELQLLRLLAERPGHVFSRREIMEQLWGGAFFERLDDEVVQARVRACDVHISNLRQKIEQDPAEPELVVTVRGVGYTFADGA